MLHLGTILLLIFCAGLASVAILRGGAGLLVGRSWLGRLEAAALVGAGVAGWVAVALARHGG